jgi:hypothetical protein
MEPKWTVKISRWNSKETRFIHSITKTDFPEYDPKPGENVSGIAVYTNAKILHVWLNTRKAVR